jgi:hypothetical protein
MAFDSNGEPAMRLFVCAAASLALFSSGLRADEAGIARYRFENQPSTADQAQVDGAKFQAANPGRLVGFAADSAGKAVSASQTSATSNSGSVEFDGTQAILVTKLPSNAAGLTEGFTWEGFFLSPAANTIDADGAIADRFLSQFVDDTGSSTRLTVGLSALKAGGPAQLCIAFAGSNTRHPGKIVVTPDVWHHFAVVHDNSGKEPKLIWYLDYEVAGEVVLNGKTERTTVKPPGSAPLTIGARLKTAGKVDRGFQGSLDEIRLSGRPLKPAEFLRVEEPTFERNVVARIYENLPTTFDWDFARLEPVETLPHEALSLVGFPPQFSPRGYTTARRGWHAIAADEEVALPAGSYRLLLRTQSPTLLTVDGKLLIDARLSVANHPLGALPAGPRDYSATYEADGKPHWFLLAAAYQGEPKNALGDVAVCYSPAGEEKWRFLGSAEEMPIDAAAWSAYRGRTERFFRSLDGKRRAGAIARGDRRWDERHQWARRVASGWDAIDDHRATAAANAATHPIDRLLNESFSAAKVEPAPLVDDAAFLRRLSLDIRGRIPTVDELEAFARDDRPDKRTRVIDDLLASSEWADGWVGYWQDVLAENPSILKPTLNNSGPFRRWIHESFRRNLPMDRFATELVLMEGSDSEGGTAGFAVATENDAPMAMKAHIVMKAFLAVDMQCARCHDSPSSPLEQRDLFSLAALLNESPLKLPPTSVVPPVLPGGRVPGVTASLKPGETIQPEWTLADVVPEEIAAETVRDAERPRARLAAIITSPETPRFSDVLVNRVWKRYFGTGLVEPVDEWNPSTEPSHPALLRFVSRRFVEDGYDMKALARLIFTSQTYQRAVRDVPLAAAEAVAESSKATAAKAFAAQQRRRLTAEQIVDSLYTAAGKDFDAEELTFDPNETQGFLNLGTPHRAWQLTSMSNERDRPALAMPVNQSIVDVLTTFGWRETRPDPITQRDDSPNPLQPLMLSNGLMVSRVVRLCEDNRVTELCLQDLTVEELADKLCLTVLSRRADDGERAALIELLSPGFETRRTGVPKPKVVKKPRAHVDWDKHLQAEASVELLEAEKQVRQGDPPTVRLTADFRERVEDALWCLINSPEFVFVP